jgi:predicted short-subunit dehydrogenase-like oxidoreductase (DUF2520 family)
MKPSYVIIGCGRVGRNLARHLKKEGYRPLGFASRSIGSAQQAASAAGMETATTRPWEITPGADLIFITTPDGAIETVCEEIVENGGFSKDAVVLHCSGLLPSTILASARSADATIGSMHPLQSFSAPDYPINPFSEIIVSIEGDPAAREMARMAATDLGATVHTIRTDAKTLYHAAAVVASNYLVAVMDIALKMLESAGISKTEGFAVLKPLIEGTLRNIEKSGTENALTGPIARGDVQTVNEHIAALKEYLPGLLQSYRALGAHTTGIASRKGLEDSTVRRLMEALS